MAISKASMGQGFRIGDRAASGAGQFHQQAKEP
jgi:hypothetical protein